MRRIIPIWKYGQDERTGTWKTSFVGLPGAWRKEGSARSGRSTDMLIVSRATINKDHRSLPPIFLPASAVEKSCCPRPNRQGSYPIPLSSPKRTVGRRQEKK